MTSPTASGPDQRECARCGSVTCTAPAARAALLAACRDPECEADVIGAERAVAEAARDCLTRPEVDWQAECAHLTAALAEATVALDELRADIQAERDASAEPCFDNNGVHLRCGHCKQLLVAGDGGYIVEDGGTVYHMDSCYAHVQTARLAEATARAGEVVRERDVACSNVEMLMEKYQAARAEIAALRTGGGR